MRVGAGRPSSPFATTLRHALHAAVSEAIDLRAGFIVMSVPKAASRIAPTSSSRPIYDNFTPAVARLSAAHGAKGI